VKRAWARIGLGVLVVWLAVVAWGWIVAWRPLPEYAEYGEISLPVPIMSDSAYGEIIESHPRPYVIEIDSGSGALVLYGATHTKDRDDPQIADIEQRWDRFKPTIALCESRLGILFPGLMDPLKEFGEPGLLHALARRDEVTTYTWEPPAEVRMRALLDQPFSAEQIALRVKLGPYFANLRHGRPDDPEGFVADFLDSPERWPGLESTLTTVDEIDAAWSRHFPNGPDWRDVSDQYRLPGFLGEISTNAVRDEHFARVVIDLVGRGERVFAVAGLSHAVKLDSTLTAALGPNTVRDR